MIDCPFPEIFYGGARGGGKTDGVLGKYAIKGEMYGAGFNGIFFRRELPMCDDAIERSRQILAPLGWRWTENNRTWRSPSGARLRFRPLENVGDAEKYQGQNITDACVEEAGNYADSRPIDRLQGVLRSAAGVPTQLILTGNPGGPGHLWLKERYVDPAPGGMKKLVRSLRGSRAHNAIYIPSRVTNNRILLKNNPDYVTRLYLVGSEDLVRAWLDGDWNAIQGAFFDGWRAERHVLPAFAIPGHWLKFRSFDWGYASPFSVGWWTVASGDMALADRVIPKGALIRYREWYGAKAPGQGLRLNNPDIAAGVLARSPADERIAYTVADPAIFASQGGPSIAEQMARAGLPMRPGDNTRLGNRGQITGWSRLRALLVGDGGAPMIYCFDNCADSIRTLPVLPHSSANPEDLDTTGEDHAADEWRYAVMSRPWIAPRIATGTWRERMLKPPSLAERLADHDRLLRNGEDD